MDDVRHFFGRANSSARDASLVVRPGLAGGVAPGFLRPGALAAGAAVGRRPGHGAWLLRASGGMLHRLAEAARPAGADAVAQLVGVGRSALRGAAALYCHTGC